MAGIVWSILGGSEIDTYLLGIMFIQEADAREDRFVFFKVLLEGESTQQDRENLQEQNRLATEEQPFPPPAIPPPPRL